ncbi:Sec-independent protein translocase protein TatB [Shinella zoogloeoides]|uniref:Sec-independent protein translocase protein TatB n=1 Tax=Shinella zoogloeoides TaxID=352475 RepID=A0A6N8TD87_SHIZO|nr:Sec-independent protein translocase protein TatB [Shinella zoogloeoides]MXN99177.1 twin-arginine translocase subunit TatB [Shinella zoogloeoides]UEX83036.1 Sec-independent protein translocase protein TatB [Shinella zoogloeoides]
MLDVGWTEILVIAIVLIIVVGPKDLPQMLRTFGRMVSKMRGMASDFRQQFDEALREADLDDVRKTIGEAQKLNPLNTIRDAVNPLRQMGDEIKSDLQKATSLAPTPASDAAPAESVSSAPVEAVKPVSAEPVAAAPLKAEPVAKASKKAEGEAAKVAKPRKAAAKPEGEAKAAAKKAPAARKAAAVKPKTAKTKKDEA